LSFILNWLRRRSPGEWLFISFGSLILLGTILLSLPFSTHSGEIPFLDALFTATSAVCVTGLIVVDTGKYFTSFGQAVILFLIQLGGFGIMSFGTFIIFMLGGRVSISAERAVSQSFIDASGLTLKEMLKKSLLFMFLIEFFGAVLLFLGFGSFYSFPQRLWQAVFHSISAFCNAGFSLNSDSLTKFADNLLVNLTMMGLIVIGGIGFFVLLEISRMLQTRQKFKKLTLHTKIVLLMSGILIFFGAGLLIFFEWNQAFADFGIKGKILRGFFQSITARTAGFNTVEIGSLSEASLMVLLGLMFIGGAPGSCAGGVKVTSAGVILTVALGLFRRIKRPSIFGRSLSRETIDRALLLLVSGFLLVNVFILLLLILEGGLSSHHLVAGRFLTLAFEAISAFGTVGLSLGITPHLSFLGKILIIFLMFTGRLGPLTLIYALQARRVPVAIEYPEEEVMIG